MEPICVHLFPNKLKYTNHFSHSIGMCHVHSSTQFCPIKFHNSHPPYNILCRFISSPPYRFKWLEPCYFSFTTASRIHSCVGQILNLLSLNFQLVLHRRILDYFLLFVIPPPLVLPQVHLSISV